MEKIENILNLRPVEHWRDKFSPRKLKNIFDFNLF